MSSLAIMLLMVGPVAVSNMPFELFLVFSYDNFFQTKCNLVKALDAVHNVKSVPYSLDRCCIDPHGWHTDP